MSEPDRFAHLSPLKRAFLAIEELQSKVDRLEQASREPIAIVGIGCRFPGGADDPDAFWRLLHDGVDTVGEIPSDRWDRDAWYHADPDAPGKMATRQGAFLEGIGNFDAPFFNISPREAAGLDPQQRLLLEVAWEALEHAGVPSEQLAGTRTGVFIGAMTKDYAVLGEPLQRPDAIDAYTGTGTEDCFAAGRLSYTLGLQGPSLTVETACSSSLVALHLACQSLRAGESNAALAGGVGLILSPAMHVITSKVHALAADGRCKTFDAAADGYGRGEGCGILLLKRLSTARADGDRVLALVRGSAVNHDGASGGLTVPSGLAQQAVIRQALDSAGVTPHDVSYVDAHGTGTPLGDPIELGALGAVLGTGRTDDEPFFVGSVKTNIGHLEAAAGVAGVVKVVLSMLHREIPPHLHFRTPNPRLSLAAAHAIVPTVPTAWTPTGRRIAGVSSFGISGTNAHVVLEEAPSEGDDQPAGISEPPAQLLTLSARSEHALDAMKERLTEHLSRHLDLPLGDVCATANRGRSRFAHRYAVVAASTEELQRRLAAGEGARGQIDTRAPRIAFLFTGQGAQWSGMGRQLFDVHPLFRDVIERCNTRLQDRLPRPLLSLLFDPDAAPLLERTDCTQPALYALQVALAAFWRSAGVEPAMVLGHSVGELAAAHVAGLIDLEEGLELAAERGRLMQSLSRPGAMAAIMASESHVRDMLQARSGDLSIAVVNGPTETVVSGDRDAVLALVADLEATGEKPKRLRVSHAFHSPLMDPILDALERRASTIAFTPGRIPLISNRTGVSTSTLSARDLRDHAREPVRFADGLHALDAAGCRSFVEIGPGTTLTALGRHILDGNDRTFLPSLRKGRDDWRQLLDAAGTLYTLGVPLDFAALDTSGARRRVTLPTYPFERKRHWLAGLPAARHQDSSAPSVAARAAERTEHPLLGARLRTAQDIFEVQLTSSRPAYLADHQLADTAVFPAAGYVELGRAAGAAIFGTRGPIAVEQLRLVSALVLDITASRTLQTIVDPRRDGCAAFRIFSLHVDADTDATPSWTLHASGSLRAIDKTVPGSPRSPDDPLESWPLERSGEQHYARFAAAGLEFGPAFRTVRSLTLGPDRARGVLRLPDALTGESDLYPVHPVLLDGALQVLGAAMAESDGTDAGGTWRIPTAIARVAIHASAGARAWCEARVTSRSADGGCTGSLRLFDDEGRLLVEIEGLESQRVTRDALLPTAVAPWSEWLYDIRWVPRTLLDLPQRRPAARLRAPDEIADALASRLPSLEQGLERYDEVERELDEAAGLYARVALHSLGWRDNDAAESIPALAARLGVAPPHHRLLERLCEMLADDPSPQRQEAPDARLDALSARAPAHRAEIDLVRACGRGLAGVLRGNVDPLQLLFPEGAVEGAAALYQDSPMARAANLLVAEAAAEAIAAHPGDRPLRVLEIGGGTGGTTFHLLPRLLAGRTEYVFTDIGAGFLARAERRFGDFTGFRTQALDIEHDPSTQGFAAGGFDLILAANVLHATVDLAQALAHARSLLAPGGILLVLEGTTSRRWVDLVFGLTAGWWRFTDVRLRPSHPLLSRDRWETLLGEVGFEAAAALPRMNVTGASWWQHQAVFAARAPLSEAAHARDTIVSRPTGTPDSPRAWLIFADRSGVGHQLADRLLARGESCRLVYAAADDHLPADPADKTDPADAAIDPLDADGIVALVRELAGAGSALQRPHDIVHLWALDTPHAATMTAEALDAFQQRVLASALHLVQGATATTVPTRVHFVTRGAAAVDGVAPSGFAAAGLWGFGRVVALEHPELHGASIDLDPTAPDTAATSVDLDAELHRTSEPDHVALRGGQRWVERLLRRSITPARVSPLHLRADGTWLVTGGLKGLGLATARFLVEHGVRSLVLAGRSTPSRDALAEIDALTALGAHIVVASLDVSRRKDVRTVLDGIRRDGPPLRGIVHSAGFLDDGLLAQQPWSRFAPVLGPKIAGAFHLHAETLDDPLDYFLLYSSTAGILGSAGQANHAAANAFLDALAQYRRAIGRPALSLAWGAWSEIGSAARQDVTERLLARGIGRIETRPGLAVLERLFDDDIACTAVLPIDWPTYLSAFRAGQTPPLLATLALDTASAPAVLSAAATGILERIDGALPGERREILAGHVREAVLKVLGGLPDDALRADQGFQELGLDSLMALELRNVLQGGLGVSLPSTLVLNYPTVETLTANLAARLSLDSPVTSSEETAGGAAQPRATASAVADDVDDLLADVLSLSEEDARTVLRRRS
jgi:acyl transferase domain-containing protein/acyl carrier protein